MIQSGTKFIGINPSVPTPENRSSQNNAFQEVYTIDQIAAEAVLSEYAITEVSTTYTALTTDRSIKCTGANYTVSIFTSVGRSGRRLTITNAGTGVITVDPNGSETINGYTTISLMPGDSMSIEADGANWSIV